MKPQIIIGGNEGAHNGDLDQSAVRIKRGKGYRDLSTVCVVPTRGQISARVVESWMGLMPPMNQPFTRIFVGGMEVAEAYNAAVDLILNHDTLSKWKYMLTLEEDNLPPADGLLKLYESIDDYAVVGGLYWTKGEGGQPMIYGKPGELPMFAPQIPELDTVQEANGLGMGFNLFRLELFRDERLPKPWFKTLQENGKTYSQDLYFYEQIREVGYKVACDTRIKVGHHDVVEDRVW